MGIRRLRMSCSASTATMGTPCGGEGALQAISRGSAYPLVLRPARHHADYAYADYRGRSPGLSTFPPLPDVSRETSVVFERVLLGELAGARAHLARILVVLLPVSYTHLTLPTI